MSKRHTLNTHAVRAKTSIPASAKSEKDAATHRAHTPRKGINKGREKSPRSTHHTHAHHAWCAASAHVFRAARTTHTLTTHGAQRPPTCSAQHTPHTRSPRMVRSVRPRVPRSTHHTHAHHAWCAASAHVFRASIWPPWVLTTLARHQCPANSVRCPANSAQCARPRSCRHRSVVAKSSHASTRGRVGPRHSSTAYTRSMPSPCRDRLACCWSMLRRRVALWWQWPRQPRTELQLDVRSDGDIARVVRP